MTGNATSSYRPVEGFLDWLGLRRVHTLSDAGQPPASPPGDAGVRDLAREVRHQLAEAIMAFLLDNDLEISPANLVLAHGAFSGANPGLERQIVTRARSAKGVTQPWLDELAELEATRPDHADLDRLIVRLEEGLEAFHAHMRAARAVASDYGSHLERHVIDLEEVEKTGQLVNNLAGLAKAMLERTRKAEDDMRRSEEESRELRRSLAHARRDAEIDYLTGLPNRRAFEALLEHHYAESRETGEPLSVAFCDIDEFKRINDVHGHDAGDRVIKAIADALAHISDDRCHVARHGGEEFVMLFRGLTLAEAARRLDTAREELASRRLINRKTDQPFGRITFSGGVADVLGHADPRGALKAADEALYRAKQNGRNRIELA